jgi:predicted metal-dependent phosphotriesterase family hydrolase
MRVKDVEKFKGGVVVLDLVNNEQITTELKDIDEENNQVTTGKIIVFSHVINPQTGKPVVIHTAYSTQVSGASLVRVRDEYVFDLEHVVQIHEPHPELEVAYREICSGLKLASAGVIKQLDAAGRNPEKQKKSESEPKIILKH